MKKKSNNYFTKDTENAIVLYNNTEDPELRSIIYEKNIHYSFFKLTENIIHTFKFYNTEVDDLRHLQQEIIVYLLSKIHLFDLSRGAKAYSYFGTAVKRWLINYDRTNYQKKISHDDIDMISEDNHIIYHENENCEIHEYDQLSLFIDEFVKHCTENLTNIFQKKEEKIISDSILELFRKRENITIFNKKAIYIYIKEMIPYFTDYKIFNMDIEKDKLKYNSIIENNMLIEENILDNGFKQVKYKYQVSAPQITKVANVFYKIFKENYSFYLNEGYIEFKI